MGDLCEKKERRKGGNTNKQHYAYKTVKTPSLSFVRT